MGVTYIWTGPGSFTSTSQNPSINPSAVTSSGTYTVTAVKAGCISAPAVTSAVVHAVPQITSVTSTDPKTCFGTDGTITLNGLTAGVQYELAYSFNGVPYTSNVTATASGKILLTGLPAGVYSGIIVTFSCASNTVGPVSLKDPLPAPDPILGANSPICTGKTLKLTSTDQVTDLTYEWTGPNGFTSNLQNPEIPNVGMADSGVYSLTIKYLNCASYAAENVIVHPPTVLTDVTPSQIIPLGSSLQLHVNGAEFYTWTPSDGTLSNPTIDSPLATPTESITYTVVGINRHGCRDTASISIIVDDNISEFLPNAFTPNNDGQNDIFRIGNMKYDKLVQFNVYNRWGQLIYHNTSDPNAGWDGTFNGVAQDMGTYSYSIIITTPAGKDKVLKGDVLLIR